MASLQKQLVEWCDQWLRWGGATARIPLVLPGRWRKTDTRRLWPGGPVGYIVHQRKDGIVVEFSALRVVLDLHRPGNHHKIKESVRLAAGLPKEIPDGNLVYGESGAVTGVGT